jgi:putative oxidoreductase
MATSKAKSIASWVLIGLVAVGFLLAALGKLTGAAGPMFESWGYPSWFATLIGVLELAGAIGLLVPKTTRYAVFGLTLLMLGAAYTHVSNGEASQLARPSLFLVVMWVGLWLRGQVNRN